MPERDPENSDYRCYMSFDVSAFNTNLRENILIEPEVLSFSCFGTLVDWKKGIVSTLKPLFEDYLVEMDEDEIYNLFRHYESELVRSDFMLYRSMLKEAVRKMGRRLNLNLSQDDCECLVRSLPSWPLFPDSVDCLRKWSKKYKLALICNADKDLLEKSILKTGLKFDYIILSEDLKTYKPSQNNFIISLRCFEVSSHHVLHLSENLSNDIVPCNEVGIPAVWINRYNLAEPADEAEKALYAFPDLKSVGIL